MKIGQRVPTFSLPDTEAKLRGLSELAGDRGVTIAFFPFAFSGTCDKEACALRDQYAEFRKLQTDVVGISVDSVYSLRAFALTYGIPFPLLSDFNKRVTRLYGVLQDSWVILGYRGVAKRSVFTVDRKGVLRYRWIAEVPAQEPPYDEVTKAAASLAV